MRKYDVRFCDCGRVHFILADVISEAVEQEKEVLFTCTHCGATMRIGADEIYDEYSENENDVAYMMYSYGIQNDELSDLSKIHSIIYSEGERIPMMTGGDATDYCNGFVDWKTKNRQNIHEEEWNKAKETVNMEKLIKTIAEDKLKDMSGYVVGGLNWVGTKFERLYHK